MKKKDFFSEKAFTISELLTVFVVVLALAAAGYPFARSAIRRRDHVQCRANLMQAGQALYIYASEHGGSFPDSIDVLYDEEYLSSEEFLDCPATVHSGSMENPDYVYNAGLTVYSDSDKVLLADRDGNHVEGRNVLFVKGTVKTE